jgi:YidC/Oxa1 family membrane protein insertase
MGPLVKKQLHQAKAMRSLQPELKRIKRAASSKQEESTMLMELYKEKGINPFSQLGVVVLQLPIFLGLYSGLHKIILDPNALTTFAYPALRDLSWMKQLAANIHLFDSSLFGVVDLTRAALPKGGGVYLPALLIVFGSAIAQYFQSKQLMPASSDGRRLRDILKDASSGQQADQSEVNAAVGRSTRYFIPVMIFFITLGIASALSLYWFVGGLVAFIQQSRILKQDETELEDLADAAPSSKKQVIEGEVIRASAKKNKKTSKSKKRRR